MPQTQYKQGDIIQNAGEALRVLSVIDEGGVTASFGSLRMELGQGDVAGLPELNLGAHCFTYTAASDVTLTQHSYGGFGELDALISGDPDLAYALVTSMWRQMSALLQHKIALLAEADSVYEAAKGLYPEYERLCALYALTPKKLPAADALERFKSAHPTGEWLFEYYMELGELDEEARRAFFYGMRGITQGFLRRSAEDAALVTQGCAECEQYLAASVKSLICPGGHDLFSLIADLHQNAMSAKGADDAVDALMARLAGVLRGLTSIDGEEYRGRLSAYEENLKAWRGGAEEAPPQHMDFAPNRDLAGSLDVICEYSDCAEETHHCFARRVQDYIALTDRSALEDAPKALRRELTALFYEIYNLALIKSISDPAVPTVVKMFLSFGYVDADLAGQQNAAYLYSIADSLKGAPDKGVYTVREWLAAVYAGQKEPSRNENDMDYAEYVRDLKNKSKIDDKEERRLLGDKEAKLRFELENVFPTVNKLTFGTITTFCPLLADNNIQRRLDNALVTPALLTGIIDEIRSIDFAAYSRETMYSNAAVSIANETVHLEILPNIILMPNVGTRGVLWQEIEGKKRATPARMFLPLFMLGDLKALMIRLTGEFRWEMCKLVQGMRWNDITNPSLTSVFSDFLQFYRNNRDLSPEAKEDIRNDLIRANNNYKRVFVFYYTDWLVYESTGAPRLHKALRLILLTYCPFTAAIREKLARSPMYAEMMNRYNHKQQQRIRQLSNVTQKFTRLGKPPAPELLAEIEFAKS
ncbi:MAG: hypothetical protein LBI44_03430 [Oscillospiraceae bacterium]|jgi:hypothetical protein|nr:hypothetical protein [Oscillospiraceae bacterium]